MDDGGGRGGGGGGEGEGREGRGNGFEGFITCTDGRLCILMTIPFLSDTNGEFDSNFFFYIVSVSVNQSEIMSDYDFHHLYMIVDL